MAAVASSSTIAGPSSSTSRLESILIVARSTKPRGAAAANLIHQAIAAPGVFFFGELFDVPGVSELASHSSSSSSADTQLATAYQLLCLFAYGTYQDYVHLVQSGAIPELTRDQTTKLRQLTLVSLAAQNKFLYYDDLHYALDIDINKTRELEDLIIETIYAGLATGKLNELQTRFEIHHVQGRDVPHPTQLASPALSALPSLSTNNRSSAGAGALDATLTSLQGWQSTTVSVLETLQARMESVKTNAAESETQRNEHHQALLSNLVQAQHDLDAQKLQQQPARGKGKATASNAMEIDELDNVSGSGGRAGAGQRRGRRRLLWRVFGEVRGLVLRSLVIRRLAYCAMILRIQSQTVHHSQTRSTF